jgi:hypothetical protein
MNRVHISQLAVAVAGLSDRIPMHDLVPPSEFLDKVRVYLKEAVDLLLAADAQNSVGEVGRLLNGVGNYLAEISQYADRAGLPLDFTLSLSNLRTFALSLAASFRGAIDTPDDQ